LTEDGTYETTVDLNAPVHEVFRHLTDPAAMHGPGWGHFLGRLAQAVAGADPGPDPWLTAAS